MVTTILIVSLLAAILTENITEVFVKDEISQSFRVWFFKDRRHLKRMFSFFGNLITCGRCFSGWVSLLITIYFFYIRLPFSIMSTLILWQFVWFLSNILHHIRDRINPNHHNGE